MESERDGIDALMTHFANWGKPYESREALIQDLIEDALSVWIDDHFSGNDPCNEEEGG